MLNLQTVVSTGMQTAVNAHFGILTTAYKDLWEGLCNKNELYGHMWPL